MQTPGCEIFVDADGRELAEHGTALFPIAVYADDLMNMDVPWHWHDEFEAIVVTEGAAVFAADRERITLKKGDGCFVNANILHGVRNSESKAACRLHSLVFHPRLIGGSTESIYWQKYVLPVMENRAFSMAVLRTGEDDALLHHIERAWQACAREPEGFEFLVRSELSQLFLPICARMSSGIRQLSGKELRDEQRMKEMLIWVRAHLSEGMTVKDIAAAASVSESECIRCFRKMIGITPIRYVIQMRLQRAAQLLLETEEKVADIGAACGFQEMGYFARTFRRQYGVTPSAYRRKC